MQLPEAFKEKYTQLLGADASAFLASFDDEPMAGFRRDPAKPWPLDEKTTDPIPWSPWGIMAKLPETELITFPGWFIAKNPVRNLSGQSRHRKKGSACWIYVPLLVVNPRNWLVILVKPGYWSAMK